MTLTIDSQHYNKAISFPPGHGYQLRKTQPTSIVVHSTSNSHKDTAFVAEAKYLFESAAVSAHYLIGKGGQIIQMLEPGPWTAWHAGGLQPDGTWTAQPAFANPRSIGVEMHHSVGDPPYPKAQLDAMAWLVRDLTSVFQIAPAAIETHGQIALPGPYIRKHDPEAWPHGDFLRWRSELATPPVAGAGTYRVTFGTAVYEAPRGDAPIALGRTALLLAGEVVDVDGVTKEGWAHLASGLGFSPVSTLERV